MPGSKVLHFDRPGNQRPVERQHRPGKSVRLEFAQDAVNAYVAVPIPQDFPIGGGKMFRARGRFRVSLGNGGAPYAILEDVTVLGLSLPKAWLGGLKGENLIGQAMGERNGSPVLQGIKSLRVEPGALVIEVDGLTSGATRIALKKRKLYSRRRCQDRLVQPLPGLIIASHRAPRHARCSFAQRGSYPGLESVIVNGSCESSRPRTARASWPLALG